jgi:hypothetical protein
LGNFLDWISWGEGGEDFAGLAEVSGEGLKENTGEKKNK